MQGFDSQEFDSQEFDNYKRRVLGLVKRYEAWALDYIKERGYAQDAEQELALYFLESLSIEDAANRFKSSFLKYIAPRRVRTGRVREVEIKDNIEGKNETKSLSVKARKVRTSYYVLGANDAARYWGIVPTPTVKAWFSKAFGVKERNFLRNLPERKQYIALKKEGYIVLSVDVDNVTLKKNNQIVLIKILSV